jgi:hypothetical protein
METETVTNDQLKPQLFSADDLNKVTDFFSILIEIDQKNKRKEKIKKYENTK